MFPGTLRRLSMSLICREKAGFHEDLPFGHADTLTVLWNEFCPQ
jgi:transketolase